MSKDALGVDRLMEMSEQDVPYCQPSKKGDPTTIRMRPASRTLIQNLG